MVIETTPDISDNSKDEVNRMQQIRRSIKSLGINYGTPRLPLSIVHYTSISALPSIIGQNHVQLRFSDYRFLNDSQEGVYYINVVSNCVNELCTQGLDALWMNDEIKNITIAEPIFDSQKVLRKEDEDLFFACFSLENDSLPMWNYYANGDTNNGCNLEFDTVNDSTIRDLFKKEYGRTFKIMRVIYDLHKQIEITMDILREICLLVNHDSAVTFFHDFCKRAMIVFKQPACAYEQEVRFVYYNPKRLDHISHKNVEFLWSHGLLKPYITLDIPLRLNKIKIGPLDEKTGLREGIKYLLDNRGFSKTEIDKSTIRMRY